MLSENPDAEPAGTAIERDVAQAGAVCYRRNKRGRVDILLVGSRRNGRWGIPKGHIDDGETSSATALREAFEEAGATGTVDRTVFGTFTYHKDSSPNRYEVTVHLLQVSRIATKFPEKDIRKTRWTPIDEAIRDVAQPGLRIPLSQFS